MTDLLSRVPIAAVSYITYIDLGPAGTRGGGGERETWYREQLAASSECLMSPAAAAITAAPGTTCAQRADIFRGAGRQYWREQ